MSEGCAMNPVHLLIDARTAGLVLIGLRTRNSPGTRARNRRQRHKRDDGDGGRRFAHGMLLSVWKESQDMHRRLIVALPLVFAMVNSATATDLVLKRAMLSSGGVGYFEYEAEVDGSATLGLDLPLDQIDDVLKSLVVYDSAGSVGGIELPGRDTTHAAFADAPIGPEALDSPVDYLNGLRGVMLQVSGPRPMTGRLLRAERMREGARDPADTGAPRTRVTLLAADGLRQFVLEDADAVQVADPDLRARIERALEALRRDSGSDARHVTIRSDGTGRRVVRVGYVAAAPLWKTSYRLVLPAKNEEGAKARLQGWAVLENATGADWNGVQLSLQYGNPVTFRQAIYRTYYVERPEVPVQILGRLLPDIDTRARPPEQVGAAAEALPPPAPAPFAAIAGMARSAPGAPQQEMSAPTVQAATTEGAEETLFTIPGPVILAAGHTASVPILDREIPAARVALAIASAPHPTAAVRITNDSTSSLPAGVLTLYDPAGATSYVGDARLGGLPIGEERLLPFAEDLRTTLDWHTDTGIRIASASAAGGVLTTERRTRQTWRIVIVAPAREPRTVLLQIPTPSGQTLVVESGAEPAGEIAGATRLRTRLAAGQTQTVMAYTDRVQQQRFALLQDAPVFAQLIADQDIQAAARTGLRHLAELRAAEAARVAERDRLKGELTDVEHEEDRLRANIGAVPANDALHTRLIRQLDAAETRIATLSKAIEQAASAATSAHAALEQAVQELKF